MVKRIFFAVCLFATATIFGFAGDIASFVNLGFSEDGRYFMFGQYGINEESLPYAEIFTVDVPGNNFITGGVFAKEYPIPVNPGQEGQGALFTLLHSAREYVNRYRINHMKPGRILYLLLNGDEPKENLSFRDFQTGRRYSIDLVQSSRGSGKSVEASFYISMTITPSSGASSDYTIGRPGYYREGVIEYQIRSLYVSPDEASLVFVIERKETDTGGANIRYMVETVSIR